MSEPNNESNNLNQLSTNEVNQDELYEYFKDILEDNVNTV